MATEITMPKLGLTMTTGKLVKWFKNVGDKVEKGEIIYEVMTDKITNEIEAPVSGIIFDILVQEGEEVPVGTVIALISEPGDITETIIDRSAVQDNARNGESSFDEEEVLIGDSGKEKRQKASPLARKVAKELGIDLSLIIGSGPDGTIEKEDVLRCADKLRDSGRKESVAVTKKQLTGMRQIIATRLTASYQQVPHVYFNTEADMSDILQFRKEINSDQDTKISVTDFLVKATAEALKEYQDLNSSLQGEEVLTFSDINIGLAVAVDKGILVPVIRNADHKSLNDIANERINYVTQARLGTLAIESLQNCTFTVSNLGPFGISSFTAIINPPQAAILAVGRIADRPVASKNSIVIRPVMQLTLGVDHRLVDGILAAMFINKVKELLEAPWTLSR